MDLKVIVNLFLINNYNYKIQTLIFFMDPIILYTKIIVLNFFIVDKNTNEVTRQLEV